MKSSKNDSIQDKVEIKKRTMEEIFETLDWDKPLSAELGEINIE